MHVHVAVQVVQLAVRHRSCACCLIARYAGGGRALMLACLSPLKAHAEESLNTLHFASMALRIKSQPVIMMDPQVQRCACDLSCTLFYTYSTQVV
jgi:hypothetical protein